MTAVVPDSLLPIPPLPPGSWLGMLGGGQLGRMFCMAAQTLGYRVCVLDPGADSPAGAVADRHLRAGYTDEAALAELAALCRSVTTEFENVPAGSLEFLARRCVVSPAAVAVAIAQDRIAEKAFIRDCGIATAPYVPVLAADDLRRADPALLPGILKVARLGYDGKGQARVATLDEALAAFDAFGGLPCVLEKRLDLELEVSVVVARGFDGQCVVYPTSENVHVGGILATSTVPARVSQDIAARAEAATRTIARELGYVGVLCVEFFVLGDSSLTVNEMAPRPHNSGHYTIDACVTSQFEQQVRAMAGGLDAPAPVRGDGESARRRLAGSRRRAAVGRGPCPTGGEAASVRQVRGARWPQDGPRDRRGRHAGACDARGRADRAHARHSRMSAGVPLGRAASGQGAVR
jgi:5-(carboxyamino)imidazole ribonucleotide synthase